MDITSFVLGYNKGKAIGGEGVEASVALAMADGDQVITPADGQTFSKVTVQKPDTLIAENIAEGVDIGGIIGTLTASSNNGGVVSKYMFAQPTSTTEFTMTHNLGVIPDLVVVFAGGGEKWLGKALLWLGRSRAAANANINFPDTKMLGIYDDSYREIPSIQYSTTIDETNEILMADTEKITVKSNKTLLPINSGKYYYGYAIAGLT